MHSAIDPRSFMVTPEQVTDFFAPIVEPLFDPVSHEFDFDTARVLFDGVVEETVDFICKRVAEAGGCEAEASSGIEHFLQSLEASFRGVQ